MNKNYTLLLLCSSILLFTGCSNANGNIIPSKLPNNSDTVGVLNSVENLQDKVKKYSVFNEKTSKKKRDFKLSNDSVSSILNKIELNDKRTYLLKGDDLLLNNSSYTISSYQDLKYYVKHTTDYILKTESNFKKGGVIIVKVVRAKSEIIFDQEKVVLSEEEITPMKILHDISKKTGYSIVAPDEILKKLSSKTTLNFFAKSYRQFFEYLEGRYDYFIVLDSAKKQIKFQEYKVKRIKLDIQSVILSTTSSTNSVSSGEAELTGSSTQSSTHSVDILKSLTKSLELIVEKNKIVSSDKGTKSSFEIDPISGIVTIIGSPTSIREMEETILSFNEEMKVKIAIKVSIFELSLRKEYRNGIDWGILSQSLSTAYYAGTSVIPDPSLLTTGDFGGKFLTMTYASGDGKTGVSAVLNSLGVFGEVSSVRSFNLLTLNNIPITQSAAKTQKYLEKVIKSNNVVEGAEGEDSTGEITSEPVINTISEGVNIQVTPRYNKNENTISMMIQPTIVKLSELKKITYGASDDFVQVPDYLSKTLTSNITIKNGDTILMAGVVFDDKENSYNGLLPGATAEHEPIDSLSGVRDESSDRKEIIILLNVKKM